MENTAPPKPTETPNNNYLKIVPFIRAKEGGLSSDTNDSASANPCPYACYNGRHGIHTSNGWTWEEWKSIKGDTPDSAVAFYNLSDPAKYNETNPDWADLFKKYFWDIIKGDEINFLPLVNMIVDMAFNSSPKVAIEHIQGILGYKATGVMDSNTLASINLYVNQNSLYKLMIDNRDKFYEWLAAKYPKDQEFLNGWEKRVQDLIIFNSKLS